MRPHFPGLGGIAIALCALAMAAGVARAAPFVPASDDEVVERLRDRPLDPTDRELRQLRARLRAAPDDLALALAVAQRCIAVSRRDGDPRWLGYAEAALAPWWQRADAPPAVALLQAVVLQSVHEFDPALAKLDAVLRAEPGNAQAWLTRASVLQARGRYREAGESCRHLQAAGGGVYAEACLQELRSLTGEADAAAQVLEALIASHPQQAGWLALVAAELAERRGDSAAAERHYRAALAASPDAYTKGAWADFLLDRHRDGEVIALVLPDQRADPLLLRLALAYRDAGDPRLGGAIEALQARFDAARLRGDTVHLREEARFELELRGRPVIALDLARRDWNVQREPADARILLDSARAAGREAAAAPARDFVAANHLQDARLAPGPR